MSVSRSALSILATLLLVSATTFAQAPAASGYAGGPITVLWWDNTPDFGGQAPDALREEMSDFLDDFGGGSVFDATYVSSQVPGELAAHLALNSYDVIVFDSTGPITFDNADRAEITAHYLLHRNLVLDGTLYVRHLTDVPGPLDPSNGGLLVNEVGQLGAMGGGLLIGTDNAPFQEAADNALAQCLPTAAFSGSTDPSGNGQFNGTDLIDALTTISHFDVFLYWIFYGSEGVAPTGTFTDVFGGTVQLHAHAEVADIPGTGPQLAYISATWPPDGVEATFDCNDNGVFDLFDIQNGTSLDTNGNGLPDECDVPVNPWTDQGCALPGIYGDPVLWCSGSLLPGSTNQLVLTNAAENAQAGLFWGTSGGAIPFKGGTLKPDPWDLLITITDAAGEKTVPFVLPAGAPTGTELWAQWAIFDVVAVQDYSLSNAFMGVTN